MSNLLSRSAVAVGIAAAFALAPGFAHATPLTYGTTTFGGYNAAVDQSNGRAWVSPNIANGRTWSDLRSLCPVGVCSGALTGLTWASNAQVNQFWGDIGIPTHAIPTPPGFPIGNTYSYSAAALFGEEMLLGGLINFLGPTHSFGSSHALGITDMLGGLTNNALVDVPIIGSVPNTSYMFHFYSYILGIRLEPADNESAFTFGAGNGYAEFPATKGWFYVTPEASVSAPEPGSLGMLGAGLGLLVLGLARGKRTRNFGKFA